MRAGGFVSFVVLCLLSREGAAAGADASFQGLGCLPSLVCQSNALGVSADGKVVVGNGYGPALRWDDGVVREVLAPGFPSQQKWAFDASADGRVVVGRGGDEGFVSENGQFTSIGNATGVSALFGVSEDGRVAVGFRNSRAIRREGGNEILLGDLPGGNSLSLAYDVSSDGRVVAGRVSSELGFEAFRWEDGVMTGLGGESVAGGTSEFVHISPDGSTLLGWGESPDPGLRGFRWRDGVFEPLGTLPGGAIAQPFASDRTGDLIVGSAGTPEGDRAFVWDERRGIRLLSDFLAEEFRVDTSGWTLLAAKDMSPDGLTIVGDGINPEGRLEAWIMHLPERRIEVEIELAPFRRGPEEPEVLRLHGLAIVAMLGSDVFDVASVDRKSLAFGPARAMPLFAGSAIERDVNRDGWTDLVSFYRVDETGVMLGDESICLSALTLDEIRIEGCTGIVVRKPGRHQLDWCW